MKNKKLLVICGIIAIVVIFLISKIVDSRYKVDLQKIENKDAKYFLLEKDNRYGVINESGEVLVSPTYSKVSIPDPRKAIFLCTENGEKWKALNEKNEVLYSEYNSVEAIDIESVSSNIPYEKSVLKYKSGNYYGLMSIDGKKITDAKYESIEIMRSSHNILDKNKKVKDPSDWTSPKTMEGLSGDLDKATLEYTGFDNGKFYVVFFLFDYNDNMYTSDLIKVGE